MQKIEYKEFTISYRLDGHCALIYWGEIFIHAVAGELTDSSRTDIEKAKKYIDTII